MRRTVCWVLVLLVLVALVFAQTRPPATEKQKENDRSREVVLDRLMLTNVGFALTLRAVEGADRIEMIVGFLEGQSIDMAHRKEKAERPMTHDIFKTFLDRNGWRVERVVVRDLVIRDGYGTFVADLVFQKDGQKQIYDARPSDSIALALRSGAKIFVADKVFELQRKEDEKLPEPQRRSRPGIT